MKILYINGIKFNNRVSNTYLNLKKILHEDEIYSCEWQYNDNVSQKIYECIKQIQPDLIVASSTAGLFATDFDVPIILINPVVDKNDLERLFPDKDFSNYPEKPSKKTKEISLILSKNDELLDYKKAQKFFKKTDLRIVDDSHRLKNLTSLVNEINIHKKEWSGLC